MKYIAVVIAVLIFSYFICFPQLTSFAQEEAVIANTSGIVLRVSSEAVIINEYDAVANTMVEATYAIDADTQFENVVSIQEIAVGDSVDISYTTTTDGKNIAAFISCQKATQE